MAQDCCEIDEDEDPPQTQRSEGDESVRSGFVSEFTVSQLDCPSEEQIIRMALGDIVPATILKFDTPSRKVSVFHAGDSAEVEARLSALGLGAKLLSTTSVESGDLDKAEELERGANEKEARILKWLLAINGAMFAVEIVAGISAQSTGLIADSLDMFADAAVYGLALYAVGRSVHMKVRAAHVAGWLQVILAVGALSEVLRRFVFGSAPESSLMMSFGVLALIANILCLVLIAKNRDGGAHMKASWIFSANDVIANLGVILAGFLVAATGSNYPDLAIGLVIAVIVLNGARRILKLQS